MASIVHSIAYQCYKRLECRLKDMCEIRYNGDSDMRGPFATITIRPFGTSSRLLMLFRDGSAVATDGTPAATYYFNDPSFPFALLDDTEQWATNQEEPWTHISRNPLGHICSEDIQILSSASIQAMSIDMLPS